MPTKPKKLCAYPGCPVLCSGKRCERHAVGTTPVDRPAWHTTTTSSTERGYGTAWQKLRRVILARDPICKICTRAWSTTVDHIKPKAQGGDDSETNLRGTCVPCHKGKTAHDAASAKRAKRGATTGSRQATRRHRKRG